MTDPITPKAADDAPTLLTAWKAAQARLKTGRIDSPAIDARLLLEAAAGASRMDILTDPYRPITTDQLHAYEAMVDRRPEARAGVAHRRQEGVLEDHAERHPRRPQPPPRHRDPDGRRYAGLQQE